MDADQQRAQEPVVNIVGEKIALGPFARDWLPLYLRWANDFAVMRMFMPILRPITAEAREEWYGRITKPEPDTVDFTIYERPGLRAIGYASLEEIDHRHRTATYGLLIGEKDCWGKGYGTETTRLMLDYAFTVLDLHNVFLSVHADNHPAIRAYTRAGFREIGRRRDAHWVAGRRADEVYMDCLATEFPPPVPVTSPRSE
jgi:RimJ/RimL family protein N-acetyltransferase